MAVRRAASWPVNRPRTGIVALAVPDLEEPWFAELTAMLVRDAGARGLSVLVQQTAGDRQREIDVANGVGLPEIDGVIHIPRALRVADLTRRTSPGPLVLLGEHIRSSPFSHVTIDNLAAARAAARHLLDVGRRRVAAVGPRLANRSDAADRRYAGYREALEARGLGPDDRLVVPVDADTSEEGARAAHVLVDSGVPFDGVVCFNDSIAIGLLSALHERGVQVPDDVAVVGIDDVRAARFATPALTSVAPDRQAMVAAALRLLEQQIATPRTFDVPVEQVVVGFELKVRASTARAAASRAREPRSPARQRTAEGLQGAS